MSDTDPTGGPSPDLDADEAHLEGLGQRFMAALEARRRGDVDTAAELHRQLLKAEPRLAEPHLELAGMLLQTGQVDEAAEHARQAVELLESGAQWVQDLEENVVLSVAWNTLGEALRRRADADEVVFGDPDTWKSLMTESKRAFQQAARLDPDNAHAQHWGFNLSLGEDQA